MEALGDLLTKGATTIKGMAMKYEVQTRFGRGNWENVWHDGEHLAYFASPEEAQAEIDDMIEEMELQGMDYDRDDYIIVQVEGEQS